MPHLLSRFQSEQTGNPSALKSAEWQQRAFTMPCALQWKTSGTLNDAKSKLHAPRSRITTYRFQHHVESISRRAEAALTAKAGGARRKHSAPNQDLYIQRPENTTSVQLFSRHRIELTKNTRLHHFITTIIMSFFFSAITRLKTRVP